MKEVEKTLVLGGDGFLGSYFRKVLGNNAIIHATKPSNFLDVDNCSRFEIDDKNNLFNFLKSKKLDTIINCIAMADIEECEKNPNLANWINSQLPSLVSNYPSENRLKLVHISTDAVFSGKTSFNHENSIANPKSIYGKTKLLGEKNVLRNCPSAIVCRVNFYGDSKKKKSLFKFFYENLKIGNTITGFQDVHFTPLYAMDTVRIVMELIDRNQKGLFHVVGDERISKFEFGMMVAEILGVSKNNIQPGNLSHSEYSRFRTLDLSLSNDKIKNLNIVIPNIESGLKSLINKLEKEVE